MRTYGLESEYELIDLQQVTVMSAVGSNFNAENMYDYHSYLTDLIIRAHFLDPYFQRGVQVELPPSLSLSYPLAREGRD